MKDKVIELITKLEHTYRWYSISEKFHDDTRLTAERKKSLKYEDWPQSWKTVYFKAYPRLPVILLPKSFVKGVKDPLDTVFYKRMSCRSFKGTKLTTRALSTLLFYTGGIQRTYGDDWNLSRRFYASGGARYPLEIYVVLYNNTELPKGIYHYNVKKHALELLKKGDYFTRLQKGLDPPWIGDANMAVLTTSVFGRNQIKYGDRGYRMIMAEAGHMAQNLYLVAGAIGLGCCALGGYIDDEINDMLDVDGANESVVYATIVGTPKK